MPRTAIRSGISIIALFLSTTAAWATDSGAVSLDLVRDGEPTATIVVAQQPTRSAQLAASELQYHVRKITGATLPIANDEQTVVGNRVLVGESQATASLGLKRDDFAPQEYLIRFQPGTLILLGRDKDDRGKLDYDNADASTFPGFSDEQSTCYAVYDFLERYCQVRWYLPTELGLCCPATKTLQVSGGNVRRSPAMKYRDFGMNAIGHKAPADLCGDSVRTGPNPPPNLPWRENIIFAFRHRLGGATPFAANHSLYGYYDRFWKEGDAKPGPAFEGFHPEFFAQGYPGKPPQLCYSNPALVQQVVQDARDYFDGKGLKSGAQAEGDIFAVVPMDNDKYCMCPNCATLVGGKHPATRGVGSFSNPDIDFAMGVSGNTGHFSNDAASNYFFAFVNQVAREIIKSHPHKYIGTIAYSRYAYPPTDMKLESNVWLRICMHPRNLYNVAIQENDRAVLDAWVAESKDRPKVAWLYYCFPSLTIGAARPFRCFPGFFAHSIVGQMQVYRKAGLCGIFCEPAYIGDGQRSLLMDQLEFYVTWKLADDPTLDGNATIDEFFHRYYGSAALPMKAFYELVEQTHANGANYPSNVYVFHKEEVAWKHLGTQSRMDQLRRFMDDAHAAATTDIEKRRVALFDKGIWQYMQAGRKAYLSAHSNTP
jgi:hypothetical protein